MVSCFDEFFLPDRSILVAMQAAEKLGIVYIGKAGGKVIFRLL